MDKPPFMVQNGVRGLKLGVYAYIRGVKHMAHGSKPARHRVQSGPRDAFAKCKNYIETLTVIFHS